MFMDSVFAFWGLLIITKWKLYKKKYGTPEIIQNEKRPLNLTKAKGSTE